ncbi:histidine phosphatase family protein [Aspergillus thermomutatus]|uniref:Histidine acid phosphatase n=1 Tax=Aspergillus thermomutatus TaxID=41047 RepID=A0A397GPA8_ASPTH|nr:uncharacterized protein CDV56_103532 [Aspergillus thermomutatus]RHZ49830.1 hypothetical protein CDV56_103532 [Aspergillus thermomutatus]
MLSLGLTLLFSGTATLASRDTFYPPLNHTTFISNTSYGTYGGIYTAPADSASSPSTNDAYNYCSMPHPRGETYSPPPPVANHTIKAQLDQEYNCDNINPHVYAAPASQHPSPVAVYGQAYSDPTNPFLTTYVNGSCQYPQLTLGGFLDGYQHGRDLRAVYGDQLRLIPSTPDQKKVWFRSSSSALTQGSAGAVLRGIWPDYHEPIPLHQQASAIDTVDRGFPCSARDTLLSTIQSTAEWTEHLTVTQSLRDSLATMFGAQDESAWTSTFDHFADNFQARLCNGYELPCRVQDRTQCVTAAQADEVFRAGDWEYNYWWRRNANATRYIQLVEGLFIGEIVRKLEAVAEGTSGLSYSHNFVHDGDIAPILGALGIKALRWPGMGSNIAFEVWKTSSSEYFARVLYSGHTIETIHGRLDWIPLSTLLDILRPFIPEDIISMCN